MRLSGITSPVVREALAETTQRSLEQRQKLRKATRAVEGYFVGMLLKKMHETSTKGGLFKEDNTSATYRDMFDDAVAQEIGKRGSFGIADTLYNEMVVHLDEVKR